MSKNYFVAYDLNAPGQDYARIKSGVIAACSWYMHLQKSLFYVRSDRTLEEVYGIVRRHIDVNDLLIVIDANDARLNLPEPQMTTLQNCWVYGNPQVARTA